ncbi:MAG: hypothetical protein N2Z22_06085 [Turneriella sp.]|nr:hypothetical protein [Leptospiraceae bacterium]MCX7632882.1 hypothetical protein [Turneriella sp.]
MKTKTMHTTSVSLPENVAQHWQKHQREIMRFAARFLRLKMRNPIRRGVTRSYNDAERPYRIVTTRFTRKSTMRYFVLPRHCGSVSRRWFMG